MQSMLPTFERQEQPQLAPALDHDLRRFALRRPLMQSAVRQARQVSLALTRNSSGDIVEATKLNWPIGQRYLQNVAPVNTRSIASAAAK